MCVSQKPKKKRPRVSFHDFFSVSPRSSVLVVVILLSQTEFFFVDSFSCPRGLQFRSIPSSYKDHWAHNGQPTLVSNEEWWLIDGSFPHGIAKKQTAILPVVRLNRLKRIIYFLLSFRVRHLTLLSNSIMPCRFFLSFLFFFFFLNRSDNGMKPQALNVSLSLFLSILVIACKRTFECRVLLFLFFSRMCLVCFIPPSGRLNLFRLDTFGKWVQSTMSIKKRSKFRTRLVLGILSLPDREAFFQVGWFHNHRWNSLSLSLKSKAISYGSFRSLFAFGKMRVRRREAARQDDDERWAATMRMGRSEFLMRRRRWSGKRRRRPAEWMHPRSAHNAILLLYTTAQ